MLAFSFRGDYPVITRPFFCEALLPNIKITKSQLDKLGSEHAGSLFWDTELSGFGIKVLKDGGKTYIAQYRTSRGRQGKTTRVTIGRHGAPWTADMARDEARRVLGRAALGQDPAAAEQAGRKVMTVAQLCDEYLKFGTGTKKASTLATDGGRVERHIKPLLGARRITEVTSADVSKFLQDVATGKTKADIKTKVRGRTIVRGGKGTASRTVGLLGGIFSYAVGRRLLAANPVRGVERYPDQKNVRFLDVSELGRLGSAIAVVEQEGANPKAIAIIRLLVLTGARRSEIERLRMREIDLASRVLRLADSKTGQKVLMLNAPAITVLGGAMSLGGTKREFVFENADASGPYAGLPKVWERVRVIGEFQGLRMHDLRHSFASLGVVSGTPLAIIGALLGHAHSSTTQRYAHLADDPIRNASEIIGSAIANALSGGA
jgi:integrase